MFDCEKSQQFQPILEKFSKIETAKVDNIGYQYEQTRFSRIIITSILDSKKLGNSTCFILKCIIFWTKKKYRLGKNLNISMVFVVLYWPL